MGLDVGRHTARQGREEGIYRARNIGDMTFGDNGDVSSRCSPDATTGASTAMTDDATADDISLQLVTDTDAPQVYPDKLGYGKGVYATR